MTPLERAALAYVQACDAQDASIHYPISHTSLVETRQAVVNAYEDLKNAVSQMVNARSGASQLAQRLIDAINAADEEDGA